MKRLVGIFSVAILAILVFSAFAIAGSSYFEKIEKEKVLVIGLNQSYPPFTTWKNDKPHGFDVEFARNLAAALGLDPEKGVKFVPIRPADAAQAIASGKIDLAIAGLSRIPDRMKSAAFSVPYVYVSRAALVQRAKIPRVIIGEVLQPMPVSDYYDLKKLGSLRIGVTEGTAAKQRAAQDFPSSKTYGYADSEQLGKAFLKGDIDAVIHEDPFVRYFWASHKSKGRGFIPLSRSVTREGLCVAYRYGDPDFARFLDGYILYLIESGTIDKWKARYFDKADWAGGEK